MEERGGALVADEDFEAVTGPYRRELLAHCYRMLGSVHDAEDLLQETLLRAWKAYDRYDAERASLRTWLYRIATNACLTALEQRTRRPLPSGLGSAPNTDPQEPLVRGEEVPWLQPIPDSLLDPQTIVAARGTLRLAFVAAIQLLPARQRAVLILRDVLDWPAKETAEALRTTTAAVNSALQRARARLSEAGIDEQSVKESPDPQARDVVDRYVAAFERADLAALEALLTRDALLEMPPFLNWYVGRDDYLGFLRRVFTTRGTDWSLEPVSANGQPAVAAYAGGRLHTLQVFTVEGGRVARTTVFQDPELFAIFDLPEFSTGSGNQVERRMGRP